MKKYLVLLVTLLVSFTSVRALEINTLGFKSSDLENIEIHQRDNKDKLYFMYSNDIYAMGENDDYIFYVRSIANPFTKSFGIKTDITDELMDVLDNSGVKHYSYIFNDDFKWIKVKYNQHDYNLIEYYTAWNDIFITLTFQSKTGEYTFSNEKQLDQWVKQIKLSGEGKVEGPHVLKDGIDYFKKKKKMNNIIILIICIIAIGFTYYMSRIRGRKKN